ncbi:MAG: FAD-dependent oxidoreductase [Fusobacteriota bacterium]
MSERIVVVGGGAGGMTAATQIRKKMPDSEVVVFEKTEHASWAGCPMPYYIAEEIPEKSVLHHKPEYFKKKRNIDVYVNHEVRKIDFNNKKIKVVGDKISKDFSYDKLILSTGNSPLIPKIKGYSKDIDGLFNLSHATDGLAIKKYLDGNNIKKGIVVGAGFIGMEMAESFQKRGLEVKVVELQEDILPTFDFNLKRGISKKAKEKEIDIILGKYVSEIKKENGKIKSVVLNTGEELETEIILMSVGVKPNLDLLENSDYPFEGDKFTVNDYLETKYKDVYAIGDMIYTKNYITDKIVYAPFGDVADKQGIIVAENISGKKRKYNGVGGTFATSFFDIRIAKTGLSLDEAKDNGWNADSITLRGFTKISSFEDSGGGKMELIYDKDNNSILGAAMAGDEAIAQFIDQVAIIIANKISLEDIFDVDYAYSPTNSTVWNPLLVAYRKLIK